MSAQPRRHQFYGRRVGHALRPHQAALMAELLPRLRVDLARPLAGTGERSFLEIGFGGGEHLAHLAELHPDVSFLGAEPFVNGVAKLLALVEARKLANVRIHDGDGRDLLEALPAAAFERVYLLYPDPWPKARHNRRRFVNAETLAQIHRVLEPRGQFLFATMWPGPARTWPPMAVFARRASRPCHSPIGSKPATRPKPGARGGKALIFACGEPLEAPRVSAYMTLNLSSLT